MNRMLEELLDRVRSWPDAAQEELARLGFEIEAEREGVPYRASDEELRAIDEADAGGIAAQSEVDAVLAKLSRR